MTHILSFFKKKLCLGNDSAGLDSACLRVYTLPKVEDGLNRFPPPTLLKTWHSLGILSKEVVGRTIQKWCIEKPL